MNTPVIGTDAINSIAMQRCFLIKNGWGLIFKMSGGCVFGAAAAGLDVAFMFIMSFSYNR